MPCGAWTFASAENYRAERHGRSTTPIIILLPVSAYDETLYTILQIDKGIYKVYTRDISIFFELVEKSFFRQYIPLNFMRSHVSLNVVKPRKHGAFPSEVVNGCLQLVTKYQYHSANKRHDSNSRFASPGPSNVVNQSTVTMTLLIRRQRHVITLL